MDGNLVTRKKSVEVTGFSKKSQIEAINNAFRMLQTQVLKNEENAVLYMKPVNVDIVDYKEESRVEKFLMMFFPKERKNYFIRLNVEVEISVLEIRKGEAN